MTRVYLGLGSNLGDRRANLTRGLGLLAEAGFRVRRVSPVVESPALLPDGAPADWNIPFLNIVAEGDVAGAPGDWLQHAKRIEAGMGRGDESRWAPRPLDIDTLLWSDAVVRSAELTIPHRDLTRRAFVLSPLVHLRPDLRLPGGDGQTVLQLARRLRHHLPLWMGILNVTPDSFSGDGQSGDVDALLTRAEAMIRSGAHILDLGAESTRPGAAPVAWSTEWSRLQSALDRIRPLLGNDPLRARISVDTRHPEVARRALEAGADIINDPGGLQEPAMRELARDVDADWIAMHSLTLPADRNRTLPDDCDPVAEVKQWFVRQLETWTDAGIDLNRVVIDPGIGFGKNSLQSLDLMRHVQSLYDLGVRVLVGHSRKSFMAAFSGTKPSSRDLETIGASLKLCEKRVDILRVHDVAGHVRAYSAWAHLEPYA